ncbi:hypothetical protein [Lyngbya sp. PCC 8106]|uniref:hypothetical protein n=1 Tax=Lyngbya sp. (strain PCC 8106) TaxID=313612 RepID=UPI0000EACD0D|nr:hypothetical protein [Lyngbya sp. PCC 8106]EAW33727.1 hypothetical protein L8106_18611 [Lyngbya sp. PCC 8106]
MTTTVALIAGVQLSIVEAAQARFEPENRTNEFNVCQVTSGHLDSIICPVKQTEEQPPNTNGSGGGR